MEKFYPKVDIESLGDLYVNHLDAMTREGLNSKSDIAAQLAWRDQRIASLIASLLDPSRLPDIAYAVDDDL